MFRERESVPRAPRGEILLKLVPWLDTQTSFCSVQQQEMRLSKTGAVEVTGKHPGGRVRDTS